MLVHAIYRLSSKFKVISQSSRLQGENVTKMVDPCDFVKGVSSYIIYTNVYKRY